MPCPVLTKPATRNLPCRTGKLREKNRIRPRNHLAHRQLPIFLKYLRVRDRAERTCSQGRRRETLADRHHAAARDLRRQTRPDPPSLPRSSGQYTQVVSIGCPPSSSFVLCGDPRIRSPAQGRGCRTAASALPGRGVWQRPDSLAGRNRWWPIKQRPASGPRSPGRRRRCRKPLRNSDKRCTL